MKTVLRNPDSTARSSLALSGLRQWRMKPLRRLRALPSAIDQCLRHRGKHECAHLLSALALVAAFGCASPAEAFNTYTVTTTGDPGPAGTMSLREAVAAATAAAGSTAADNVVQFDPALVGSTITLLNGEIAIDNPLTITGPGAGLIVSGNDASRIFHVMRTDASLSGLTLTNGKSDSFGGALRADYGTLDLADMVIRQSRADYGGGIGVFGGDISIERSRILDNSARELGGGIDVYGGQHTDILRSTISGNIAGHYGGGLNAYGVRSLNLQRSTVSNNIAAYGGSPYGGGGVSLQNVYHGYFYTSTIARNFATQGGGGIGLQGNAAFAIKLETTTVAENATQDGSGNGIFTDDGLVDIEVSIVANNFSQGGNEDLSGNFFSYWSLIRNPGSSVVTGGNNLIGEIWDPMLGPLADNGGYTFTMLPAAGSPVLDIGLTKGGLDQRDLPRQTPASYLLDMGAVERQYPEQLILRDGFDSS